jgi:alpha-L-arabinofuranosidase
VTLVAVATGVFTPLESSALTGPPPVTAAAAPVQIKVLKTRLVTSDGRQVETVPAGIVGVNQRWPDDGKGIWNPVADEPAADIVKLSRDTGLHTLRYPGGTVANLFDFTRAIGPQAQRRCQTSGGFANGRFAATDSRFGPDENEKFADAINGETMVMVPAVNRSAANAADYVEYMNAPADGAARNPNGGIDWAEVRARNGHREPYHIRFWEYGNEPYLLGQHYWWSPDAATRVRQFIQGGWQRQTATDPAYQDNDGLFAGCDLLNRQKGTGTANQAYRVRFNPIGLPGDETGAPGVGDGPITEPVLRVAGTQWRRVTNLSGQPASAQVFTVDKASGVVHFGDGTHGAVPPAGASLSIQYTSGPHQGYIDFRKAMKKVDPSIEVCSGWGRPEFVAAMGSGIYDCLGTHSYSTPPDDGTLTRYGNLQAAAAQRDADLKELRNAMARHFPDIKNRPDLLVTEYGTLNTPPPAYEGRLAHVLYLAAQLAGQLENDVRVSINSNTANVPLADGTPDAGQLFGSPPDFIMTGRTFMLRLYANMVGGHVITSNLTGNPTLTAPNGTYPALRVVSSCRAGVARTMVINRDADHPLSAAVTLPGQNVSSNVEVTTVSGASIESFNAPTHPDDITERTTRVSMSQEDVLKHNFAPHSVTLLQFTGPAGSCVP